MPPIIMILTVLTMWLWTIPTQALACQVNKSSALLKEIRMLNPPEGALVAEQSIYARGIGKETFSLFTDCQDRGVALTEFRLPESTFIVRKEGTTIGQRSSRGS